MVHGRMLGGVLALVIGLSLLIWLHPTIGLMHGGLLDGSDLRSPLIQICAWLFLIFAGVSTLTMLALVRVGRPFTAYSAAYSLAVVAVLSAIRILDRFY